MGEAKLNNVTVLLVALLLLSSGVQDAAAMPGTLNYDAIVADEPNGKNKDLYRPVANANKYTRGCEPIERCRGAR
ncbi:uncharacterized protein LOC100857024 precursor [Zea mays]|jgi:hypothetical protein|uniref:Uncharacterized protein n=1 Tax=Zea mays TaxID=4577 RepID=A0A1D6HWB9_MAIZE|nr:uncharacterized protein LOC100857024 precursor [Zea mays]ONM52523.1 hypothetical protein ZEAMMB73_Zm00001d019239 [Zea mays]|eukprot:NP_001241825.2 uncharacterized protein LOC100857024 precursor [Zea mays]